MPLALRRPISTWELKDPDVDPDDPYALRPDDERGTAAVGNLVNHYMLAVLTKGQATAIDALPGLRQTGPGVTLSSVKSMSSMPTGSSR
jgi:hypothetical protein